MTEELECSCCKAFKENCNFTESSSYKCKKETFNETSDRILQDLPTKSLRYNIIFHLNSIYL